MGTSFKNVGKQVRQTHLLVGFQNHKESMIIISWKNHQMGSRFKEESIRDLIRMKKKLYPPN